MAGSSRTVRVRFDGDSRGLQRAAGQGGTAVDDWRGKLQRFNQYAVGASLAVGAAFFAVGKRAVFAASDMEQSFGAVDAVFKGNAAQVKAWAKDTTDNVRLPAAEFAQFAAMIGAQLKNAGIPMDELGGRTKDLMGKAADMAAQFGGPTSRAVEALSAGFRGEFDPLEQYGFAINMTAINAKKAEMGMEGLTGAADRNATVMAYMALVQEQGADTWGQSAREAQSFQAQMESLKEETTNMAGEIGFALMPAVKAFVGILRDEVIPFIKENKTLVAGVVIGIGALAAAVLIANAAYKVWQATMWVMSAAKWAAGIVGGVDSIGNSADRTSRKLGARGGAGLIGRLGALGVAAASLSAASEIKIEAPNPDMSAWEVAQNKAKDQVRQLGDLWDSVWSGNWGRLGEQSDRFMSSFLGPGFKVNLGVRDEEARAKTNAFLAHVNSSGATVNVNGNTIPASGALGAIQAAINSGQGTVTINGQSYPANQARIMMENAINLTAGWMKINGDNLPATGALARVQALVTAGAGTITIDGQSYPAQVALNMVRGRVDATTGRMTIDGNNNPAVGQTNAAVGHANRSRGTMGVGADTGGARSAIDSLRAFASRPITTIVTAITRRIAGNATGALYGFADGGIAARRLRPMAARARMVPPNTWRVVGDNLRHPEAYIPLNGSRFSDALLHTTAHRMGYSLAPMAAGGTLSPAYLRDAGSILGRSSAPSAAATVTPDTYVTVILDGEPIRATIRTELDADKALTARRVRAGALRGV